MQFASRSFSVLLALTALSAASGDARAESRPTLTRETSSAASFLGDNTSVSLDRAIARGTLITDSALPPESTLSPNTIALPPAPSSSVLVLWAIGSLGAWQLGSAARKWNFSSAPDWFADDGPQQIGHATIFDLSFSLSANYPDAIVCVVSPLIRCIAQRCEVHPPAEVVLAASAPRGPPVSR